MIRREEFNKILQLIDAGIIASNDSLVNISKLTNGINDSESFNINFNIGSLDDPIIIKSTNSIDENMLKIQEFIDIFNQKEQLRITKNKYSLSWKLSFYGLVIDIEDILFDGFKVTSGEFTKSENIASYLTSAFKIIKLCLIDPTNISNIQAAQTLGFEIDLNNLRYFKEIDSFEYTELIKKTNNAGKIRLTISYSVDIMVNKIGGQLWVQ